MERKSASWSEMGGSFRSTLARRSACIQDFAIRQKKYLAFHSSFGSPQQVWHTSEAERARCHVQACFQESKLEDLTDELPTFIGWELTLGKQLGKGGFCTVHEIRACVPIPFMTTSSHCRWQSSQNEFEEKRQSDFNNGRRVSFARQHRRQHEVTYAIKFISREIIADRTQYAESVADMAIEARILSAIDHPNIVTLHGVAACGPYKQPGYFLIMDRLYDTLEKRLTKWESRSIRRASAIGFLLKNRSKGNRMDALMEERLTASADLSDAIAYLHKKNIVYRDLKPGNIGFDVTEKLKLFDFGLATELRSKDVNKDGTYNRTTMTGSLRYMAPEVALGKPYNVSCDVYSFAVLLWQIFALEEPYFLYSLSRMDLAVMKGGQRPLIQDCWPESLKTMLEKCWSADLGQRYSMMQVTTTLRQDIIFAWRKEESSTSEGSM